MSDSGHHICNEFVNKSLQAPAGKGKGRALESPAGVLNRAHISKSHQIKDFVVELPLELIIIIFLYLPLHETFLAKRVSRGWYDKLSSRSLLESLVQRWTPGLTRTIHIPDGKSAQAAASLKLKHLDSYRTGNAFSMKTHFLGTLGWETWMDKDSRVAYSSGVIAWLNSSGNPSCWSLNITTGEKTFFTADSIGPTARIAVSPSIIVILSLSRRVFIWTLRDQKSWSYQMSFHPIKDILLAGDTLAIVFAPRYLATGLTVEVWTWTLTGQREHTLFLGLQTPESKTRNKTKFMLDQSGGSIVVFERVIHSGPPQRESFHATRTIILGKPLAQSSLGRFNIDNRLKSPKYLNFVQTGKITTMWFTVLNDGVSASQPENGLSMVKRICYDFERNRVVLQTFMVRRYLDLDQCDFFFWESVLYHWTLSYSKSMVTAIDLQWSTCTTARMITRMQSFDVFTFRKENIPRPEYRLSDVLFGDDVFIIRGSRTGIEVWCFDENLRMAKESLFYRRARLPKLINQNETSLP